MEHPGCGTVGLWMVVGAWPHPPAPAAAEFFPFELVRPELERVEISIREQVRGFDPAIEPYVAYICNTSGKRIRPALAILVGGAVNGVTDDHVKLGVILELIHMATLVHDDIIDGAKHPPHGAHRQRQVGQLALGSAR
jgi:hypothetical protein